MGFAILRHGKVKGTGKGVCVAHNRRLAGEAKENIDATLTPLNVYWQDAKVVSRINEKLPEKRRKDAVEVVELLLSASPEFFDSIETDRRKLAANPTFQKWVKETVTWAKKELGQNIVDIALHLDEHSPHFHVLFVPLIGGRLCAKDVTSRNEMVRRQSSYADAMGQFGLLRGESATETHRQHIPLKGKPATGGKAIDALKADLAKSQESVAKLERMLNFRKQENQEMKQALAIATDRDRELVAEITALRAQNQDAQATLEQLRAIDRVLVDQARERLAAQRHFWARNDELKAGPPGAGRAGMWAWSAEERAARVDELCRLTQATDGMYGEERALRELQEALQATPEVEPSHTPVPDRQQPSTALLDAWKPIPATGTHYGSIVAVEGPWAVQHTGQGVHVLHQVRPGAVQVGQKVTISAAGQVTALNAPAQRGGHGRG